MNTANPRTNEDIFSTYCLAYLNLRPSGSDYPEDIPLRHGYASPTAFPDHLVVSPELYLGGGEKRGEIGLLFLNFPVFKAD